MPLANMMNSFTILQRIELMANFYFSRLNIKYVKSVFVSFIQGFENLILQIGYQLRRRFRRKHTGHKLVDLSIVPIKGQFDMVR